MQKPELLQFFLKMCIIDRTFVDIDLFYTSFLSKIINELHTTEYCSCEAQMCLRDCSDSH